MPDDFELGQGIPQVSNLLGTGMPTLNSLKVLGSIADPSTISTPDIVGLISGGLVGWMVAKKYPKMVVKYIGVIVGAELGILISRMIKGTQV